MREPGRATTDHEEAERARPESRPAEAQPVPSVQLGSPAAILAMQAQAGNAAVTAALSRQRVLARTPEPATFIEERSGFLGAGIDEERIGRELVNDYLVSDPGFVLRVIAALESEDRDDVVLAMIEEGDMAKLRAAARDPASRRALLTAVRELGNGWTTGGEAGRMRELLTIINEESARTEDGPPRTIEVEVITFESGDLDVIAVEADRMTQNIDAANEMTRGNPLAGNPTPNLTGGLTQALTGRRQLGPGVRGHTALSVDGVIYSFENEWNIGGTKDDYVRAKVQAGHFGNGLVVNVSADGARQLQAALVGRIDEGAYLVGGEGICVDAAAAQLQRILPGLPGHARFDVQDFHRNLNASGLVTARRRYDNQTVPVAP